MHIKLRSCNRSKDVRFQWKILHSCHLYFGNVLVLSYYHRHHLLYVSHSRLPAPLAKPHDSSHENTHDFFWSLVSLTCSFPVHTHHRTIQKVASVSLHPSIPSSIHTFSETAFLILNLHSVQYLYHRHLAIFTIFVLTTLPEQK